MPRVSLAGRRITRPILALAGGLLMVLAIGLPLPAALAAVDVPILALLLGMMLLAASLEVVGFFGWIAGLVVRAAPSPRVMLASSMVLTALLSAVLLNDAVVLLLTPVLLAAATRLDLPPTPFLAGAAVAANVGSVATPVGNPQNAYVAAAAGIDFVAFAGALLPLALLSLALAVGWALVFFRRDLAARGAVPSLAAPPRERGLFAVLAVAGATLAAFVATAWTGWPLPAVALAGGGAAFLVAEQTTGRRPSRLVGATVPRRVNWGVLVLFVGLFLLLAGVRESGLLGAFLSWMEAAGLAGPAGLGWTVAALSNLVSNVPAVLLLAPAAQGEAAWLLLAAASTLAGNATLLGAAANVLVAEQARAAGHEFDVLRFVAFGAPLAVVTVAIAVFALA